jgi:hypothetical protein
MKASQVELSSNNDWYYDGVADLLYIYSSSDPSGRAIEAGRRSYGIYILNNNYITVRNLAFQYDNYYGVHVGYPATGITLDSLGFYE